MLLSLCTGLGRPKKGGCWLVQQPYMVNGINIPHWYRINSTVPPATPGGGYPSILFPEEGVKIPAIFIALQL